MLMAEGLSTSPLVFPDVDGSYQRRFVSFRDQFKAILKKASLPEISFHDLRHSSATLLLSEGVHPKIVQERLGHSTIGITMGHLQPHPAEHAKRCSRKAGSANSGEIGIHCFHRGMRVRPLDGVLKIQSDDEILKFTYIKPFAVPFLVRCNQSLDVLIFIFSD